MIRKLFHRAYWWVVAWGRPGTKMEGKRAVFGPFSSEVDAEEYGESLGASYEVVELPTRDEGRATRLVRAMYSKKERWEDTFERHIHSKSFWERLRGEKSDDSRID